MEFGVAAGQRLHKNYGQIWRSLQRSSETKKLRTGPAVPAVPGPHIVVISTTVSDGIMADSHGCHYNVYDMKNN